jgi:4'-phosphopantetheinyl transferase
MSVALKLYQIDLKTELCADLYPILSAEERSLAEKFQRESLKKQYLTVRVGLRQILAAYLGQSAANLKIVKTEYGKPYLLNYPEIQFNISHSGDTLLLAISTIGAVGIDIEQPKPQLRDFSALVKKCFAASEIIYWHTLADDKKVAEFYRFWTRKEAFVKAVGRGLAIGVQHCEIAATMPPRFVSLPPEYGAVTDWQLFDLNLKTELYGAIVLENAQLPAHFSLPEIISFSINQAY